MTKSPRTTRRAVLGLLAALSAGLAAEPQQVSPSLLEVEDADTLRVVVGGESYRVQLRDIDAPESRPNPKLQRDSQRTGLDAATLLALGRRADLGLGGLLEDFVPYRLVFDPAAPDRYGRVPGDLVDRSDRHLSLRLVASGYAVPLPTAEGKRLSRLQAALVAARRAGQGLWGSDAAVMRAWAGPAVDATGR